MALSMTACGAASTHTAPKNAAGTYTYENGQLYRYSPAADNKGNVRQNVTNNAGRDLRNAGKDLGNAAGIPPAPSAMPPKTPPTPQAAF